MSKIVRWGDGEVLAELNRVIKSETHKGRNVEKVIKARGWDECRALKAKIERIDRSILLNPKSPHLTVMKADREECVARVNSFILANRDSDDALRAMLKGNILFSGHEEDKLSSPAVSLICESKRVGHKSKIKDGMSC